MSKILCVNIFLNIYHSNPQRKIPASGSDRNSWGNARNCTAVVLLPQRQRALIIYCINVRRIVASTYIQYVIRAYETDRGIAPRADDGGVWLWRLSRSSSLNGFKYNNKPERIGCIGYSRQPLGCVYVCVCAFGWR